jgi:hypothetical protein
LRSSVVILCALYNQIFKNASLFPSDIQRSAVCMSLHIACYSRQQRDHRVHQHHPRRAAAALPGRSGHGDQAPLLHPLERDGDGGAREQGHQRRRPHRLLRLGRGLYDVGFSHFWHAPSDAHDGDLIYFQGHSVPGVYARAFMLGRLTEDQMDNFRQEVGGKGISSYPHPWLMPDFWQFPTVSMGLGPLCAIYSGALHEVPGQPRPDRRRARRAAQGVGLPGRRRDRRGRVAGRDRHGRPREARQPRLRDQLQPAAPRWPGARQRQDHPGARSPSSAARAGTSSR